MHPFQEEAWSTRVATITDDTGHPVFVLDAVEAPASWSDESVSVVASRYFGPGETSIRQLLTRVAGTLETWVAEQGLPLREHALLDLLLHQRGAFNSPVWFNVGVNGEPQCSACYILSVRDDMESILDLVKIEGLIFKRGSGCGTNLSTLRSAREHLTGGGAASGPVSFMRGYDAFAGVVKSGGRTRRAAKMQILDASHPDVLHFARCKVDEERKAQALVAAGFDGGFDGDAYGSVAFQNANLSVRVTDEFLAAARVGGTHQTRAVVTGGVVEEMPARTLLRTMAESAHACGDPGIQYATTIHRWHTCPASGPIHASNPCGEYLFLDDTACNLASLNLLRYLRDDATFDVELMRGDIAALIVAMEAIVEKSSYPTEKIATKSRLFRPLGLGYANLGALLMSLGLPYDSDEGRRWASALTAFLTGEAYLTSARLAAEKGAFLAFQENRAPFLAVLDRHRAALGPGPGPDVLTAAAHTAWADVSAMAREHGVRHAQVTVLAPTGTIAFVMGCDTTGIEPDLALVKYKRLHGGGTLKLMNKAVPRALRRLGYSDTDRIVRHIEEHETIEGAPGLRDEHLPVFDCAFKPYRGQRFIQPEGHLRMMAAVQPFLSGGISKTVNLPEETTVEEIEQLFLRGGELGLKALAVYRDNSKGVQPLERHCVVEPHGGCCD